MQVFDELTELPRHLSFLLNNTNLARDLEQQKAVWHKACRLFYSKSKAEKLKRKQRKPEQVNVISTSSNLVDDSDEDIATDKNTIRRSKRFTVKEIDKKSNCLFCEELDFDTNLHTVTTFNVNEKIRNGAISLNDHKLLAKLSASDLIAMESKYHLACLTKLYRDEKSTKVQCEAPKTLWFESVAFAELCCYVKTTMIQNEKVILPLTDLYKLLTERMNELGATSDIHRTRLKEKLMAEFPDLEVTKCGTKIVFFQKAFTYTNCENDDKDAMILLQAAQIVRKNRMDKKIPIDDVNQKNSVSPKLITLLHMILQEPNLSSSNQDISQAVLTIAQLIRFNSVKR